MRQERNIRCIGGPADGKVFRIELGEPEPIPQVVSNHRVVTAKYVPIGHVEPYTANHLYIWDEVAPRKDQ